MTHTPYDGSSKLFQIGLKPLDLADWIETDQDLLRFLDEKDRLTARVPGEIFTALPGSEAAQTEVLELLCAHLPQRFPDIYRHMGTHIDIVPAFRHVPLLSPLPSLLTASGLVQEDLLILQRHDEDWRLTAGALAFPSSWVLGEKIGLPIHEIHGPVPGFHAGTRNASLIARMFDNLSPANPVIRWNWSLYGSDALYHPQSGLVVRRFGDGEIADNVWLRLERQTLRKLPQTGAILFTVRIHIDPLDVLQSHADGPALARVLSAQVAELTPEQADYKGLTQERERLIKRLESLGAA